jgi:hypothetical protein
MMLRILAFHTCVFLLIGAAAAHGQEYTPAYDRIRAGLHRDASALRRAADRQVRSPQRTSSLRVAPSSAQRATTKRGGSVWTSVLIGAGVGAVAGGVWGAAQCDAPDPECTAIAVPAGLLGGAGIGAAVGAIVHAIRR